ncbi:unnamed protein product [Nippostrongylus brasiliensis]|uniref:FH2 domain-containing protein n=1 Tax=Nippostrongylus brasiliensis TaxID=27835 RepID=A0A0N4XWR0_NIPBR|nr:unnamed protein product [Nippostrongylus brasiliensis]
MGERRPPLRPLPMVSRRKPPMKVNRLTRALLPPPPPGMEPFSPAVRSARLPELLNFWRNFPFIEKQIQLEEALADDSEWEVLLPPTKLVAVVFSYMSVKHYSPPLKKALSFILDPA